MFQYIEKKNISRNTYYKKDKNRKETRISKEIYKKMTGGGLKLSKPSNVVKIHDYDVYYEYDPTQNRIVTDEYTSVYFGKQYDKDGNELNDVAVKIVENNETEISQVMTENSVLKRIESSTNPYPSCIPKLYAFKVQYPKYILITERFGPSLEALLKKRGKFSPSECVSILYKGIVALKVLHETGFVHNDIKPGNLCMGLHDPDNLKIIDFGISWTYPISKNDFSIPHNKINGTPYYVTPEIFHGKNKAVVSRHHDLQNLLYVILELANGYLPWKSVNLKGVSHHNWMSQRKEIADSKEIMVLSQIDKIADEHCRKILVEYFRIVFDSKWRNNPYTRPDYTKLEKLCIRYLS
jgi:serine/threonine protein kinase